MGEDSIKTTNADNLKGLVEQDAAGNSNLEELLQQYKVETDALLTEQNRSEYTLEKLIKALAENQINLKKNQTALQQKIEQNAQPDDGFGEIFPFVPIIAAALALILVVCMIFRVNSQSNLLKKKQNQIDDLREQIDSLGRTVKLLEAKIPQQQNYFSNPQPAPTELWPQKNFETENPHLLTKTAAPKAPPKLSAADKEIIFLDDFNKLLAELNGSNFRSMRAEFAKKYSIKAFSCENFEARMLKPSLAPKFTSVKSRDEGDFWAYKIDNTFLVVPQPTSYNDNLHVERAFSEVFNSNFVSGKTYDNIFVEKAAVFKEGWEKISKGILRLS